MALSLPFQPQERRQMAGGGAFGRQILPEGPIRAPNPSQWELLSGRWGRAGWANSLPPRSTLEGATVRETEARPPPDR